MYGCEIMMIKDYFKGRGGEYHDGIFKGLNSYFSYFQTISTGKK
jgi:hypothetical protein